MAIYSLNLGFISRSAGRSSVGFSAYISASQQKDERMGVSYDYGCKNDVIVSRILAPEDAPEWAKNSSTLWNKVEQFEDEIASLRFCGNTHNPEKNQKSQEAKEKFLASTQTAQTIMGAIPIEFSQLEAEACVEEFLMKRFVSRGLVVEYALHWEKGNPHFHGMTRGSLNAKIAILFLNQSFLLPGNNGKKLPISTLRGVVMRFGLTADPMPIGSLSFCLLYMKAGMLSGLLKEANTPGLSQIMRLFDKKILKFFVKTLPLSFKKSP